MSSGEENQLISLEEMIMLMRQQKHDILNHLQVVDGFLQLKKPELAHEYVKESIGKILQSGKGLKIQSPELVGVIYRYIAKSEQIGLSVSIEVADQFLELRDKGNKLAIALKETFELLLQEAIPFGSTLSLLFTVNDTGEKVCQLALVIPEEEQDNFKINDSLKHFIDSADFINHNVVENTIIIVFIIS